MIFGIVCTFVIGAISLCLGRRVAIWHLAAQILARDISIERAKRKAVSMALADVTAGLRCGDAAFCAQAMRTALLVANDDSDETLVKLGFKLPEKIA